MCAVRLVQIFSRLYFFFSVLAGIFFGSLHAPLFFAHAQELTYPATGVWNGFNNHAVVAECNSLSASAVSFRLTVKNNQGNPIGSRTLTLRPYATDHIPLNDFPIANGYGTYSVEILGGGGDIATPVTCVTVIYRMSAPGATKAVEYAFSLPLLQILTGSAAGMFNSINPSPSPFPVFNWLSAVNPGTAPFNAFVRVYRQDGTVDLAQSFFVMNLLPGERRDFGLGHTVGSVVGAYEIIPEVASAPYAAFVTRFSLDGTGTFVFAFPLLAQRGSCSGAPVPASTMDPAINWGEILNVGATTLLLQIEVRDGAGVTRHTQQRALRPFEQFHLYLNQYIGERSVGSFLVRCLDSGNTAAQPVVQSVYYGKRSPFESLIAWAYASQAHTNFGDAAKMIAAPANTFLGAANWNKYLDANATSFSTSVSVHNTIGAGVGQRTYGVLANGSIDVGVHETLGSSQIGLGLARSASSPVRFTSDLLRVYPDTRGGIGYIMNIHGRAVHAPASQQGSIRVLEGGRFFEFRGLPLQLIGDSVTQGWMEAGSFFDQEAYLDQLRVRGINTFMIWSFIGINNQAADPRIGFHAPRLWPWVETSGNVVPPYRFEFVGSDMRAKFNENYFSRLRALVQEANERDIVVVITVHDGWTKQRFLGHPFNSANGGPLNSNSEYVQLSNSSIEMPTTFNPGWGRFEQHQFYLERFCDRIIQATADLPNVIYEIFNEGEWYNQGRLTTFQRHFLEFFKARTERPLIFNFSGDTDLRDDPAVDVVSHHSPNWNNNTEAVDAFQFYYPRWYDMDPIKPLFFGEPVPEYEGGASAQTALMRLMWGTLLAGTGFVVQNDTMWIWNGSVDPILDIEGHAARFFHQEGVRFWEMSPSEEICSSSICFVNSGEEYLMYSQSGSLVSFDLSEATGEFNVLFYNPRTGAFINGPQGVDGGGLLELTKPDSSDWVIWVKR